MRYDDYAFSLVVSCVSFFFFFFFNDTAPTEIYTLSLHDALPILDDGACAAAAGELIARAFVDAGQTAGDELARSEEHTSELQSRPHLVCRLLLEKKKKKKKNKKKKQKKKIEKKKKTILVPMRKTA